MVPSWSSVRCRTIASPRPRPPWRRVIVESAWRKRSKTKGSTSGAMPSPVSATWMSTPSSTRLRRTSTRPPAWVNLTAFDTRFHTICWRRAASPAIRAAAGSTLTASSTPLVRAQDVGPAQDRVERRAQLVRDGGEELVLEPVRALGLRARGVLAGERLPPVLQLLVDLPVQARVLDRVGCGAGVEVHQAQLPLRRVSRTGEDHREHPDGVAAAGQERGAMAGPEAGPGRDLAGGRERGIGGHVLDHHLSAPGERGR